MEIQQEEVKDPSSNYITDPLMSTVVEVVETDPMNTVIEIDDLILTTEIIEMEEDPKMNLPYTSDFFKNV